MWFGDDFDDESIEQLPIEMVDARVADVSGSENNRVTRRHTLDISGKDVLIEGERVSVCVRFEPRKDGKRERGAVVMCVSGLIKVVVPPDLEKGTYDIELIMRDNETGRALEKPRRKKLKLKKGVRPTGSVPPVDKEKVVRWQKEG